MFPWNTALDKYKLNTKKHQRFTKVTTKMQQEFNKDPQRLHTDIPKLLVGFHV